MGNAALAGALPQTQPGGAGDAQGNSVLFQGGVGGGGVTLGMGDKDKTWGASVNHSLGTAVTLAGHGKAGNGDAVSGSVSYDYMSQNLQGRAGWGDSHVAAGYDFDDQRVNVSGGSGDISGGAAYDIDDERLTANFRAGQFNAFGSADFDDSVYSATMGYGAALQPWRTDLTTQMNAVDDNPIAGVPALAGPAMGLMPSGDDAGGQSWGVGAQVSHQDGVTAGQVGAVFHFD